MFAEPRSLIDRILNKFLHVDRLLFLQDLYTLVRGSHSSIRAAVYRLIQRGVLGRISPGQYKLITPFRFQHVYKIFCAQRGGRDPYTAFYWKGILISWQPISQSEQSEFKSHVSDLFWQYGGTYKYGHLAELINEHLQLVHNLDGGGIIDDNSFETSQEYEQLSIMEIADWYRNKFRHVIILTHDEHVFYDPDDREQVEEIEKEEIG